MLDGDGGSFGSGIYRSILNTGLPVTASAARTAPRTSKAAASSSRRRKVSLAGPSLGRDHAVLLGRSVVACPYNGNDRIQVAINRRVDVLAQERAAGRIDEAQFLVGRTIQAVFERSSGARMGSGGWNAGGSRDQTVAHELQIIYAIEDAETVRAYADRMAKTIGGVGVRFLRAILSEGQTFTAYAERTGKGGGERAASDIAKRFRWLLEALTEAEHTATGAEGQLIRGTREPV